MIGGVVYRFDGSSREAGAVVLQVDNVIFLKEDVGNLVGVQCFNYKCGKEFNQGKMKGGGMPKAK
jgi:hypothetical protein